MHVRVLSVGFWGVLIGGLLVYVTARAFALVSAAPATVSQPSTGGASIQSMAVAGLTNVFNFGLVSLLVGLTVFLVGVALLRRVLPGPPR